MNDERSVNVGLVQLGCSADPEQNFQNATEKVCAAAQDGAQIVCLPELFRYEYFCQVEDHAYFQLAESVPGPSTETLGALARELEVVLVASLFEKRAAGLYHNTLAVLDADGSYLGKYRKMHIPDDPLYYEKFYFAPGDLGFPVFETRFGKIGTLICWDQWFPEAARIVALQGAEILFFPTAIGWHPSEKQRFGKIQHESWELIQRSHAVANGCYVISVNRTGYEGDSENGIEFWGQSFVADPSGTVLARAPSDQESILVIPANLDQVEEARTHWPFLRDRRIDAYGAILQRYVDTDAKDSVP